MAKATSEGILLVKFANGAVGCVQCGRGAGTNQKFLKSPEAYRNL